MQYKDDILPIGGLNTDDDPRHMEKGDYLQSKNVRVGINQDQGDDGLLQTIKSTLETAVPIITGDEQWQYLGVATDEENDRSYILTTAYNNDILKQNFIIFKHDHITNTIKEIYRALASKWGITVWGSNRLRMYNPRIVDGKFIWTDNANDIRMVDVDRLEATYDIGLTETTAIEWNEYYSVNTGFLPDAFVYYKDAIYECIQNTLGFIAYPDESPTYWTEKAKITDCYLDILDPDNFTLAALPPLIAPGAEYNKDSTRNVNHLRGQTFQFSYRYIYFDYRKSTFAPPSIVPPPSQNETTDGEPNPDPSHNNRISVSINSGNEEVRSIEVIARSSEDISTWFLIEEVFLYNDRNWRSYPPGYEITVDFYNDKVKQAIDQTEVFTLFTYVPIRAKHMDLIEGNRLTFGHITEGYSRIYSNVTVDLSWIDLGSISTQKTYYTAGTVFVELVQHGLPDEIWQVEFYLPETNPGSGTFYVVVTDDSEEEKTASYAYNGTDPYPSTVKTGLQAAVNAIWGAGTTDTCKYPLDNKFCAFRRTYSTYEPKYLHWNMKLYIEKSYVGNVDVYPTLKMGSTHSWGIVYRDLAGRLSPMIGAGEITKYIPFPTENTQSNVDKQPVIDFSINHVPPSWARSYEIVYAGNKSIVWFLQLTGYNFNYGKKDHEDPNIDTNSTQYRINLQEMQSNTRDYFKNWSVEEYVWAKGDRIRVIGTVDVSGVLTELVDTIYDAEITGVFEDTDYEILGGSEPTVTAEWLYFKKLQDTTLIPTEGTLPNKYQDTLYFEIYRPAKGFFETLYFTTGMTFEVKTYEGYGTKYHGGDTDQVLNAQGQSTSPAIVRNTSHDAWKYLRDFRNKPSSLTWILWAESQYASDWYLTQMLTSSGNPIPDVDSQQQNVLTKRLRHGGKINIGSQVNNLAKFDYDDFLDLKDEHGPIEGLRVVGFVLKAVQYTKVVSIYIGRKESFTASGEAQYLFTDKVFGSSRPAMENWGTAHPESVITHNRHLYFWDGSEGVIVRDAANGMTAISDIKMKRWFSDKAVAISEGVEKYNQWVYLAYSMETEELFCSFGKNSDTLETIIFSEKYGKWKYSLDVGMHLGQFYHIGKRLFHLNSSNLSEWWKGTTYQFIGGTKIVGSFIFYSAVDPGKVKTFDAMAIYQKGARPVFGTVKVPEKASFTDGDIETDIYDVNIKGREGVYYCEILRDKNTPGIADANMRLVNGRRLRGLYLQVELTFSEETDPVTLSNVMVLSTPSERSR